MTATRCVLPHQRPAHTTRGLHICAGHLEQLDQDLNDLDLLLALIHDMTIPGPGDGNRRGKPVHPNAPAIIDAIAVTDPRTLPDDDDKQLISVTATLARWTSQLVSGRQLTPPGTAHNALTLLRAHLDWLLTHPESDLFTTDMHTAAQLLRRIAGEIRPPVGRHHAPHPNQPDTDCGGRLYPLPWQFGVWCIDCGETYDGHDQLRRLGLVLDGS